MLIIYIYIHTYIHTYLCVHFMGLHSDVMSIQCCKFFFFLSDLFVRFIFGGWKHSLVSMKLAKVNQYLPSDP